MKEVQNRKVLDKIERKKLKKSTKIIIISLSVVLGLAIVCSGVAIYMFGGLHIGTLLRNDSDLGISADFNEKYKNSNIKTIALFGVDGRDQNQINGRSDSITLLSINTKTNQVKLSSILRDSFVPIEGYSKQKINHAYALGGAQLAIKTINQNFHLNVSDYVSVNFEDFSTLVDSIGGIDINITSAESAKIPHIARGTEGNVHLNGEQALAYSRIRKIDSDNKRADRQKNVLTAMLQQAKTINPVKYVSLIKSAMDHMETSLQYDSILSLTGLVSKINATVKQTNVPDLKLDNPKGSIIPDYGLWAWEYDLEAASERLCKFIYEDWD